MEYADFEGVIPDGNYGAGGMIVWDRRHLPERRRQHAGRGAHGGEARSARRGTQVAGAVRAGAHAARERPGLVVVQEGRGARRRDRDRRACTGIRLLRSHRSRKCATASHGMSSSASARSGPGDAPARSMRMRCARCWPPRRTRCRSAATGSSSSSTTACARSSRSKGAACGCSRAAAATAPTSIPRSRRRPCTCRWTRA